MAVGTPVGDGRLWEDGDAVVTYRQAQILQTIADGHTTKGTARHLGLSIKTVHNHLSDAYRRLGVQTLAHAMVEAIRRGIIDLGSDQPRRKRSDRP